MLQWLIAHATPPLNEKTCEGAARGGAQGGHLEVLKWLRERNVPWDSKTVREAALNGDTEMLRWALVHGCPSYGGIPSGMYGPGDLCHMIAQHGNLEMLTCAVELGCLMDEAGWSLKTSTRLTVNLLLLICTFAYSP
jgi:hypothetical protein